ncbi:leucine--tRNA ligase [Nakamurella sp. DB0629]|uniref:Leucine--tRNA ligase n=1 Tax=Nakamurella aerolata TaxID=1656892 RepID=A0A849ACC0_9ACTN|nr:leucine--tRNA ligase [Nakamurella aerolata]
MTTQRTDTTSSGPAGSAPSGVADTQPAAETAAATETAAAATPAGQPATETPPYRYTAELANQIERYWRDYWRSNGTFHAPNPVGDLAPSDGAPVPSDKCYVLDMFPYPSGAGLHVGHPLGYIGTDVWARYLRMTGHNVLHTLGFDSFGLPAEQYAIRTGTHPAVTTAQNIKRYRDQLELLGLGHDERRSVATTDPEFVRWTQWIFTQLFEAWFDPDADPAPGGGQRGKGRARPIADLVGEFESGSRQLADGRAWTDLSRTEQAEIIDGHRLAYIAEAPVNWAPGLGTVLSNEEVTADGRSEIGNFPVFRRNMRQWMMRITAYGDRLLDDLDRLDWPESVKSMQRNWIGRSTGATVRFGQAGSPGAAGGTDATGAEIEVYTTRPDTLFGATYLVLAPEHPLVQQLTADAWPDGVDPRWTGGADTPRQAVADYRLAASRKSDLDRQENKDKTGVFTGAYFVNPATGKQIPVFIADYVLMGYGTGAIMAVPAEDTRDIEFAQAFGLPVIPTVQRPDGFPDDAAYTGSGPMINSANDEIDLNGKPAEQAKAEMIEWLQRKGFGAPRTQYKLRDWLFSRQRYWGEPFPIVYDADGIAHALPDDQLPLTLPELDDYSPAKLDPNDPNTEPVPPLGKATEWTTATLDLGDGEQTYTRELNVMPQWAGSCWYELRYLDPTNSKQFVAPENERYWMGKNADVAGDPGGVDLYVGGVEHAVLHLLYARFWHKALFDLGHVSSEEPFRRLFNQGYIQAYAYTDERGVYVPAEEVIEDPANVFTYQGKPVEREYGKMGKSLNNVVTPDDMCARYGADVFRLYEMNMGPLADSRPWQTRDVVGSQRYLQRLWRLIVDENTGETRDVDAAATEGPDAEETRALLHRTIDGVRSDYQQMSYNTAVAKLIVLTNHVTKGGGVISREVAEPLVLMTAPLAPHIAEELWKRLGHNASLAHGPFPQADPALLVQESVEYPIQVKGKVRSRISVPADADPAAIEAAALADPKIVEALAAQGVSTPKKVVVVPGRMVSIVP